MRYRITHHYATLDNDDLPTTEVHDWNVDDIEDVKALVQAELTHPGGRSGTTVTLTVTALDAVAI